MTSILGSVKNNNVRVLQILMSVPATVKKQDLQQGLVYACQNGHTECLRCLLEAKTDTYSTEFKAGFLLHEAAKCGHTEALQTLLTTGFNIEQLDHSGLTPLHISVRYGKEECLKNLIRLGANLDSRDSWENTPLITAVRQSHYGCTKVLLASRCDVNLSNKDGKTALHFGCHKAQCVESILANNPDLDVMDNDSNTPAMLAATEGFSGIIKRMIQAGCDVNKQNIFSGRTILHTVASKGHLDSVQDIIMAGADINVCDNDFRTPLWYAIDHGRFDVVKFLFRANSNVDKFQCSIEIPEKSCPVNLALSKGLLHVFRLFLLTGYDSHHVRERIRDGATKKLLAEGDLSHWIDHASGPLSLKQTCRIWIRHHQGLSLFRDIILLPLPDALKAFLSLNELDDESL